MYQNHFRLTGEPFALTPDPTFLFLSNGHSEALAALRVGMAERRGFIVMIGEVGTGKTTLLYSLLSNMESETHTAYVSNTTLSFDGILRSALRDFGVKWNGPDKVDLLEALNGFLWKCAERNETAALVVDEAQNLSEEAFEELRLLSNFETFKAKLLQIVLVGQPELDIKLRQPRLRQVAERVAVWCHVNPLTAQEARGYIQHRLEAVGGGLEVFTEPALRLLVRKSRRIPRRINILCHNAMLFAYGRNLTRVTRSVVAAAIREREGSNLVRFKAGPMRRSGLAARTLPAFATDGAGRLTPLVTWATAGLAIGSLITMLTLSADSRSSRPDAAQSAPDAASATSSEAPHAGPTAVAPDDRDRATTAPTTDGPRSGDATEPGAGTSAVAARSQVASVSPSAIETTPTRSSDAAHSGTTAPSHDDRPAPAATTDNGDSQARTEAAASVRSASPAAPKPTPAPLAAEVPATTSPNDAPPKPKSVAAAKAVAAPAAGRGTEPANKTAPGAATDRVAPAHSAGPTAAAPPANRAGTPSSAIVAASPPVRENAKSAAAQSAPRLATREPQRLEAPAAPTARSAAAENPSAVTVRASAAPPVVDRAASAPDGATYRTIGVPPGTTLSDLTVRVYGEYTASLLRLIQAANPQLLDPDYIIAGEEIRFPQLDETAVPSDTGAQE